MFFQVLSTEFLKLRRTKIVWIVGFLYCIAPLALGFFMLILMNPELARRMGLITAKAQITVGTADWKTFFALIPLVLSGGIIVLGFIEAFVFGREYAEGTAKNMLVLPIHRVNYVAAKTIVSVLCYTCIVAIVYGLSVILGFLVKLPGYSAALLKDNIALSLRVFLQTLLLMSIPAWIAVAGKGYLAPIGFTVFSMLFGQIFLHTGWAPWVPWSILFLTAGGGGPDAPQVGGGSMTVLAGVFLIGFVALCLTLDRADNSQ